MKPLLCVYLSASRSLLVAALMLFVSFDSTFIISASGHHDAVP
jgi:hypothetical protein